MRRALFVINPLRDEAKSAAVELSQLLHSEGFEISTTTEISLPGITKVSNPEAVEIAVVLGGDGTILRAAESVRGSAVPVLGVNLGRVGFLAEVDRLSLHAISRSIIEKSYTTEERMVVSYSVLRNGAEIAQGWALNEVSVERDTEAMVELFVQIDGRPLSRWGCDGVICATPTGSTAYAFSAGGPVVWPGVEALVVAPINAHALFARPMVVSPSSTVVIEVESEMAHLSADALRKVSLLEHDQISITKDRSGVLLAHVQPTTFTDRLVAKFKLPIEGWRGEH